MTPNREEQDAHDELRAAIRKAAVLRWRRMIAEAEAEHEGDADCNCGRVEMLRDSLTEVEAGLLLDYAVVMAFDSGRDHTVHAVLRTDGSCPQYRIVGLLTQGLKDVEEGGG